MVKILLILAVTLLFIVISSFIVAMIYINNDNKN